MNILIFGFEKDESSRYAVEHNIEYVIPEFKITHYTHCVKKNIRDGIYNL